MDKNVLQELINQGLSTHKIAKELGCSQTNVRYWLKKYEIERPIRYCRTCNKVLTNKQKRFCSTKCKGSKYHYHKDGDYHHYQYQYQKDKRTKRKADLVILAGGKCISCGYRKNLSALEFHHLYDKDFKLDSRTMISKSWEAIVEEAKKCILLCANCHREKHNPDLSLTDPLGPLPQPG